MNWLSSSRINVTESSTVGDWLYMSLSVEQANALLNTTFSHFTHEPSGETLTRTLSYSLPASLREHVALVHPTTTSVILCSIFNYINLS